MKQLIIIYFVFFLALNSFSQELDKRYNKSHKKEIKGWEYLFEEDYKNATKYFEKAIKIDTTNNYAYLGLAIIQGIKIDERDELMNLMIMNNDDFIDLMLKAAGGEESSLRGYVFFIIPIIEYYKKSEHERSEKDFFEPSLAEIKAIFIGGEFTENNEGIRTVKGQYKNKERIGKWKYYGYKGHLTKIVIYPDTGNYVTTQWYKKDGDIIKEDVDDHYESGISSHVKTIVYWQEIPGKTGEYLFVSKEGYCIYDINNYVRFDENTPDNIIETKFDKYYNRSWVIWKNGKPEPYKGCWYDGSEETIYLSDEQKPGVYKWDNCELVFFRELNQAEKELAEEKKKRIEMYENK